MTSYISIMQDRILFTKKLLNFLKEQGYTHIQRRGIEQGIDTDDNCILVPWKNGIAQFEDASLQIESIESTDVSDMLDVEFGINFLVELPDEVARPYLNDAKTS